MNRGGVTLIELLVVLVLAGLLTTMSAVAIRSTTPREALDSMESARHRAVREGRAYRAGAGTSAEPWMLFLPDGRTLVGPQ